jgi:hypothetical protein
LEYGTFVITFINLFIADVQVPQGGFEGRVINKCTVLQGVFKRESLQKPKRSLTISTSGTI